MMQRKTLRKARSRTFLVSAIAIFAVLATGGAVLAQVADPPVKPQPVPARDSGDQPPSGLNLASNCRLSFDSGSGNTAFNWCFSDDGNVMSIEHPAGVEHVDNGTKTEGWCLAAGGTIRGITYGDDPNVGLEAPVYPGLRRVAHNTTDGDFRVETKLTNATSSRRIIMEMKVRNISNVPQQSVFLTRFIDPDMSNTTAEDIWSSAFRSVSVTEPNSARLELMSRSDNFNANSLLYDSFLPALDGDCYDADADNRFTDGPGDRAMGVHVQLGTIFPGEQKAVRFVYEVSN